MMPPGCSFVSTCDQPVPPPPAVVVRHVPTSPPVACESQSQLVRVAPALPMSMKLIPPVAPPIIPAASVTALHVCPPSVLSASTATPCPEMSRCCGSYGSTTGG